MRALLLTVALGACGTEYGPQHTWFAKIGPLVRTHCAGCHQDGGIAPFALLEPSDLAAHQDEILTAVETGVMPPFSIDDAADCKPRHGWKDDPRLSIADKSALREWFENGMSLGDERALPSPPAVDLDANLSVAPSQPFVSSGDRDQFVCYLLDPQLTEDRWMTGLQIRPGVASLVHHASVAVIHPEDVADSIAFVGGIGVPLVNCGAAPGVPVHTWLPGNAPVAMPDGVGAPMPAGSLLSLQIHYHPNGGGGTDTTAVDMQVTDRQPAWEYIMASDGNAGAAPALFPDPDDPPTGPAFVIPANKANHVETMGSYMQDPGGELRVLSFTPHMHLVGTHERATIQHANGDVECIGDSAWSFDWQRTYTYDSSLDDLPLLEAGNTVVSQCAWNNSLSNPMMSRMMHDAGLVAPIDLVLGENTINEMCLANLGLVRRVR